MRKTKIICTVGPAVSDEKVMRQLILSGMDVARFNFSHGTHETHKKMADMIKRLREEYDLPIALLCDTKGPEIRLGEVEPEKVQLEAGQLFTLKSQPVVGDKTSASVSFPGLCNDVYKGSRILIDDGLIETVVESVESNGDIVCKVINSGVISSKKGVNVPGAKLSMPYLNQKDKDDLRFAVENDFDFIAASFTRNSSDIMAMRHELERLGGQDLRIIAKIENSEGVENIDSIIRVSDGVMVARGDLGVELPLEEIPGIQKMIIKAGYLAGKQVVTATQMLDSMMVNPRPTRAEATDIANAIYDGTSAIMLSGETAAGKYPIEAVRTMAKIAERTERDIDYDKRFIQRSTREERNVTNAISHATCMTALDLSAKAIVTVTKSGKTARMISKYRPSCMIIGCTPEKKAWRQMNLSWGVAPVLTEEKTNTDDLFDHVVDRSVKRGLLENSDLVVITAGVPLGITGTTNLLKVQLVGNILVTGRGIGAGQVCGNLCVCKNGFDAQTNFRKGDILVMHHTNNDVLSMLKDCSGIITEIDGADSHAAIIGLALEKPVIVGAENATKLLISGTSVTLDADRGIVYSG